MNSPRSPHTRTRSNSTPRIPATVWSCGPHPIDPDEPWPTPVLNAIITGFTDPGTRISLLVPPGSGSHPQPDALRCRDRALHVTTATPQPGPDTESRASDLVITSVPPAHADPATCALLARTAAHRLCNNGIFAVLTHTDSTRNTLADPTGTIVTAAQHADLLYLQHIVVLLAPIRAGHLIPDLPDTPASSTPARHRRVHSDLLVFSRPSQHQAPAPTDPAITAADLQL